MRAHAEFPGLILVLLLETFLLRINTALNITVLLTMYIEIALAQNFLFLLKLMSAMTVSVYALESRKSSLDND